MEIKHIEGNPKGYFAAYYGSEIAGKLTYTNTGNNLMIIDHTEVDNAFKGKNVGKQLIMGTVKFAREKNIKIIPLCPFAKSVFDKVDEIKDVLS
ncbi:MAG: GNAT family N-acetyltransferase [Ignavibacteriaceae bacterium]